MRAPSPPRLPTFGPDRILRTPTPAPIARCWQVAFDLVENGTQRFVGRVSALLLPKAEPPATPAATPPAEGAAASAGAEAMAVDGAPPAEPAAGAPAAASAASAAGPSSREGKLGLILSGELPISLHLEFLCRNNRTDLAILQVRRARPLARGRVPCVLWALPERRGGVRYRRRPAGLGKVGLTARAGPRRCAPPRLLTAAPSPLQRPRPAPVPPAAGDEVGD